MYSSSQYSRRGVDHVPWVPSSSYPDTPNSYVQPHRASYQGQSLVTSRVSPSLPPLRDMNQHADRVGTYDHGYSVANGQYPQLYGQSPLTPSTEFDGGQYGSRRPSSFHESGHRYSHSYTPQARPYPSQQEYSRYAPGYDQYGAAAGIRNSTYGEPQYSPYAINARQHTATADASDTRGKRRRGNLPKPITDILKAWFHDHLDHPYPSEEDKQIFIAQTGLTISQVGTFCMKHAPQVLMMSCRSATGLSTHGAGTCLHSGSSATGERIDRRSTTRLTSIYSDGLPGCRSTKGGGLLMTKLLDAFSEAARANF